MTQEEKQLLLKDLCMRLPYGVIIHVEGIIGGNYLNGDSKLVGIHNGIIHVENQPTYGNYEGFPLSINIKPYLRPMSSMTEEEKEDLKKNYHFYFDDCDDGITNGIYSSHFNRTIYEMIDECDIEDIIDWLNAHHFDYRWLIEKGLALEAPVGMYKME